MPPDPKVLDKALIRAEKWQNEANKLEKESENAFHGHIRKIIENPKDKLLLVELLDQSFRSNNPGRVADQIAYLFEKHGMAEFFSARERLLLWLFKHVGMQIPPLSIPLFIDQIRASTESVVISGESEPLRAHLVKRASQNIRVNLNVIGEAVLGESEAKNRIVHYIGLLENPDVDYVSIKISTLDSQISAFSHEETIHRLVGKVSRIYTAAKQNRDRRGRYKFINFDMEEFRDLSITVAVFMQALDQEAFRDLHAGIALQAYMPDSSHYQVELIDWAQKRLEQGGAPVKIRLVKGANMEMEECESSLRGWGKSPFSEKRDSDAHFKIMLQRALVPQAARAVHLGVGSHNIFDLAYAYELAVENKVMESLSLEMLEGMSESVRKAITCDIGASPILYAPVADRAHFTNAIAYLVRRLDENTSDQNFLRHSLGIRPRDPQWHDQESRFKEALYHIPGHLSHRTQNRLSESWEAYQGGSFYTGVFVNEPDTDFTLEPNRQWRDGIIKQWKPDPSRTPLKIPHVVGGKEVCESPDALHVCDKSSLPEKVPVGEVALCDAAALQKAVKIAREDPDHWRKTSLEERYTLLDKAANLFRKYRGDLIGIAAAEAGKTFIETDAEVSEAIDFVEYYPYVCKQFQNLQNIAFSGMGVGVVVSPWNFPVAIPTGGVAAALAAGNTVILKPASATAMTAYRLCQCFWGAGISKNTLQFCPSSGRLAGEHLIGNEAVDFVILTGGEETARQMLQKRPALHLSAETGGKDATIVTALSDRDQAIKHVLHSAFSNSGQKCSATSLLILEKEVYDDTQFHETLVDAVRSIPVGSPWDPTSVMGPVVNPIDGPIKYALEQNEKEEFWALSPAYEGDNPQLLKPSVKWGVEEGSFCHKTELFGPLLSVMKAENLEHAVNIANDTGYGLTAGIESLDDREVAYFKAHMKAGNLYINKGTTGAIVARQPFGGMAKSAYGLGRKAGVHNYVTQFMKIREYMEPPIDESAEHPLFGTLCGWIEEANHGIHTPFIQDLERLRMAFSSYEYWMHEEFTKEHEFIHIRGEENLFRYLPVKSAVIRITETQTLFDALARILICNLTGCELTLSICAQSESPVISFLYEKRDEIIKGANWIVREDPLQFVRHIDAAERIFYADCGACPEEVLKNAAEKMIPIVRTKPLMEGRLELLNFYIEQSISHSYHRYGNLGARGMNR